jgi:hypothetical protein
MTEKNHWHPAFVGATEWELKKNKIREEDVMCQALRELMSDVIEKEVEEGRKEGLKEGQKAAIVAAAKNLMQTMKWTSEQAMKALGISDAEQSEYIALL